MDLQTRKEKIDLLQRKMKKKKVWAILLALFTLGVNAFAWFVFTKYAQYDFSGNVASWDVEFRDENDVLVEDMLVSVNMKPGMDTFTTSYDVNNLGDVKADFSYDITSFSILGRTVDLTGVDDVETYLSSFYPFSIDFAATKSVISQGETSTFTVTVDWDFEDNTAYYGLNEIYDYNSTFNYYKKSGSSYTVFNATSENYASNRSTLFLEKDDADTYFGMQCGAYQDESGLDCIEIKLVLKAEQSSS